MLIKIIEKIPTAAYDDCRSGVEILADFLFVAAS